MQQTCISLQIKMCRNTVIKLGGRNEMEWEAKLIREIDTVNRIGKSYDTVKPMGLSLWASKYLVFSVQWQLQLLQTGSPQQEPPHSPHEGKTDQGFEMLDKWDQDYGQWNTHHMYCNIPLSVSFKWLYNREGRFNNFQFLAINCTF